jgi:hypothetical protein
MRDMPPRSEMTPEARASLIFWISLAGVLAVICGKAILVAPQLHGNLSILDNDSVMRLLAIQNWLGGQGWFDMIEYRLVPPEGVLMHWSRYIDALIGGLMVLLSWLMPFEMAQTAALVIWPTLLAVILVCVIGIGTRRLIGSEAACFAMLCAIVWPFTSDFYFLPGLIDHHNVQILMIALITFAIVWPGRPVRSGIVAGIAAAFGLAIGLETLPYILVVGVLLFARAQLSLAQDADRLLGTFCVAVGAAACVFWLGQTPIDRLSVGVCDQLGLPVLSLIVIAGVASIVPMVLIKERALVRFGASLCLIAVGCAVAWPLLGPCLSGPYGSLPPDVQKMISTGIVEAQPALVYAQGNVLNFLKMAMPVAGALVVATVFWAKLARSTMAERQTRDVIAQLLLLALVGILASFSQVRLLLMTAAAVPVLVGFVLALLLRRYLETRTAGAAIAMFAVAVLLISPALLEAPIKALLPKPPPSTSVQDASCREDPALAPLNAIAPAVFLTPMNLGPVLMLTTHHSSLSGPYHRSPAAFANGYLPFSLDETALRAYAGETNATHLMLCSGTTYGVGFARDLVDGAQVDWLVPVLIEAGDLLVFEIR